MFYYVLGVIIMETVKMKYVIDWDNEEICLAAVRSNGLALQYVKRQTSEICLTAVENNREALKYINKEKFPDVFIYCKLLFS